MEKDVLSEYTGDNVSKLNLTPRKFEITGRLIISDPDTACESIKNLDKVNGSVAMVVEGKKSEKSKEIW